MRPRIQEIVDQLIDDMLAGPKPADLVSECPRNQMNKRGSIDMNSSMSQIEFNKTTINRFFEAYNGKNEAILDEIIASDYVNYGQVTYMGSPGVGVAGAKHDLKVSMDALDDFNFTIEAMLATEAYPDLVGVYWKGSVTPKATSDDGQGTDRETIQYSGISLYQLQNGKMVELRHVVDNNLRKRVLGY